MDTIDKTPNWLDTSLYPFKSNYIQVHSGYMHYIDEGYGDTILYVHGTPTWSFLYRDIILSLSKKFRCIAIDHIGFGLSEKPEGFDGTPQSHAKNLSVFIKKMNLNDITIVVHDFGGPIGLGAAIELDDRIKKIVLFNTWLWETKNQPEVQKIHKLISSRLGRFLYLKMNFSTKVLLKKGFKNKKMLSRKIHQHYVRPFPDQASRKSLWSIGKSLYDSSDWFQNQWGQLEILTSKPWTILWGTEDTFITTEYLNKWKERIPQAHITTYNCGHFVQEEQTEDVIKEIEDFMENPKSQGVRSVNQKGTLDT